MLSIERLIYFLFSGKTNTSYKNNYNKINNNKYKLVIEYN